MEKYKNKFRVSSARLQGYDYGQNGAYFVTICTKNREHFFGEICNGVMQLNEIGKTAENEWFKTSQIRSDMNLELDAMVVMPNHFHAIIIIGNNEFNTPAKNLIHPHPGRDAKHHVSTNNEINEYKNQFAPQSKNLASIIRGFKSSVTVKARQIHADFAWQTRYHDHIIRNVDSFKHIQTYIKTNPLHWLKDTFYM